MRPIKRYVPLATALVIASLVAGANPAFSQSYGNLTRERWESWTESERIPMAGIENDNAAQLVVDDYGGYGGFNCKVFSAGTEDEAVTQSSITVVIPDVMVDSRISREFVSRNQTGYRFNASININDGEEYNPNILYVTGQKESEYWTFTLTPSDQGSLEIFRDIVIGLRSGKDVTFQLLPRNMQGELKDLASENFSLKGSAAAMKDMLTDCTY